jgi:hypothetical protein
MTEISAKELELLSDVLTYEALLCKKARVYSRTLTNTNLAEYMGKLADEHEGRYAALLGCIGGGK